MIQRNIDNLNYSNVTTSEHMYGGNLKIRKNNIIGGKNCRKGIPTILLPIHMKLYNMYMPVQPALNKNIYVIQSFTNSTSTYLC